MSVNGSLSNRFLFTILLLLGILISPWVWWPFTGVAFEVPRVWFVIGWVSLLLSVTFISTLIDHTIPKICANVLLSMILYVGWTIIVSLIGVDWHKSLLGNYYRVDGLISLIACVGLSLTVGWWSLSLGLLEKIVAWSGMLIAFAVILVGHLSLWNWDGAVGLTFGNPHYLAGFLVVTLPFVLNQIELTKNKAGWVFIGLLYEISIFLTQAYLSIGLSFLIWFLWIIRKWSSSRWLVPLAITTFVGVFLMWVFTPKTLYYPESRERLWNRLAQGFVKRPLQGFGVANVDHALEGTVWPYPVRFDIYVDKAHSEFVEVLIASGLIGFGLYLLFITKMYQALPKGSVWQLAALTYLLQAQLNVLSIGTCLVWWLVVGIAISNRTSGGKS